MEASWSMGGNTWQLIWHTLLPESRAGLIAAVTVTAILLVDYTSMAGVIGGGGLGRPGHPLWLSALPDGRPWRLPFCC
ncbi:ABC transporter permease [Klebsiella michiganensis]|uniref:ABC transporter permease n=1 Tax=Klebsiella michiganensis TaxID=1134687 RepID=A0A7H4PLK4_9ENTR|nr:ABC transporter permease [Klebsiella michiganensis]